MRASKTLNEGTLPLPEPRSAQSHKGNFGHICVIGGSPGMTGAVRLAAHAAQLAGAGLITMGLPHALNVAGELGRASIMSVPLPETPQGCLGLKAALHVLSIQESFDVCALGPGLGRDVATAAMVRRLLADMRMPVVLDADGLNAVVDHEGLVEARRFPSVLTPHPGEMARLLGISTNKVQANRHDVAQAYARKLRSVVVLKGHRTVITDGREVWLNTTGNPGMATGGMGDVLTGLIAGLMGQDMNARNAACLAVFVHGRAGDAAATRGGQMALSPERLINEIPAVLQALDNHG